MYIYTFVQYLMPSLGKSRCKGHENVPVALGRDGQEHENVGRLFGGRQPMGQGARGNHQAEDWQHDHRGTGKRAISTGKHH